jgi:hypothetical protein
MQDFKEYAKDFSNASRQVYGSHAYAAGYFESTMADMFRSLTVADQQRFTRMMQEAANKMVDSIDA